MKIFEYCPFCKSLLQSRDNGDISVNKKCYVCKKIDMTCKYLDNKALYPKEDPDNDIYNIEVTISDRLIVGWWLESEETYIYSPKAEYGSARLPWFEPDLSDYDKLSKKIKLYALFS